MDSSDGWTGIGWGSSSGCAVRTESNGLATSATRMRRLVERATSAAPSKSDARTTWMRRPARSTSTSGRSGDIGMPRIMSTVWRQIRTGVGDDTDSTRWARRPATGPPCRRPGSHGPPETGCGTNMASVSTKNGPVS